MSSDRAPSRRALLAVALASAALGGCFTPLYGERGVTGGGARQALANIDVSPMGSRLGVVLRNELIYQLSGGAGPPASPTHRLTVYLGWDSVPLLLDVGGGRPTVQTVTLLSTYTLTDLSTGAVVHSGTVTGSTSVDRGTQRLAAERALVEAQERAAKSLAEQLTTQMAAWLATRR